MTNTLLQNFPWKYWSILTALIWWEKNRELLSPRDSFVTLEFEVQVYTLTNHYKEFCSLFCFFQQIFLNPKEGCFYVCLFFGFDFFFFFWSIVSFGEPGPQSLEADQLKPVFHFVTAAPQTEALQSGSGSAVWEMQCCSLAQGSYKLFFAIDFQKPPCLWILLLPTAQKNFGATTKFKFHRKNCRITVRE